MTPLYVAALDGRGEIMNTLVEAGADVDAVLAADRSLPAISPTSREYLIRLRCLSKEK